MLHCINLHFYDDVWKKDSFEEKVQDWDKDEDEAITTPPHARLNNEFQRKKNKERKLISERVIKQENNSSDRRRVCS